MRRRIALRTRDLLKKLVTLHIELETKSHQLPEATSSSPVFRIVAADIGELRGYLRFLFS